MKRYRLLAALAIALLGFSTAAQAGVPDPTRSSCTFPVGPNLACPGPVSATVLLRDAFDVPVANCSVEASFFVLLGDLDPGQVMTVTGVTDANGEATLTWPTVYGDAQVTIDLTSTCIGIIEICKSDPYVVQCTEPSDIDAETWGRVKDAYR
ncbi:MAG: Ig-like domain-containing protein [bacterium]